MKSIKHSKASEKVGKPGLEVLVRFLNKTTGKKYSKKRKEYKQKEGKAKRFCDNE